MNETTNKKKGGKALVEFPKSSQQSQHKIHILKTMFGMSIKHGCQIAFIAKQPYLDQSLCKLIYLSVEHKNKQGQVCHGEDVFGYHTPNGASKARLVLGSNNDSSQNAC